MKKIIILLLYVFSTFSLLSQQAELTGAIWDVVTGELVYNGGDARKFTSNAAETSEAESKMFICDIGSLFHPSADRTGGIIAQLNGSDSKVTLSVYSLAPRSTQKGQLIYRVILKHSSEKFEGEPEQVGITLNSLTSWRSDDILTLSRAANVYVAFDAQCQDHEDNYIHNFFAVNTGRYFMKDLDHCLPGQHYKNTQPVIIELEIQGNATVKKLKVPGIGEITPTHLMSNRPGMDFVKGELVVKQPVLNVEWVGAATQKPQYSFNCKLANERSLDNMQLVKMRLWINRKDLSSDSSSRSGEVLDKIMDYPAASLPITVSAGEQHDISFPKSPGQNEYPIHNPGIIFADLEYVYALKEEKTYIRQRLPATFQRVLKPGQQDVYTVNTTVYSQVPVYQLSGGMSAEFAVQKSLAGLSAGISHTWAVRDVNGKPDLAQGGPVSVFSSPDFLDKSVKQTVSLYNKMYRDYYSDSNYKVKTVIIGPGTFAAPYLSFAMKAPILPIHFLVAQNTVKELKAMVNYANDHGYKAYATLGYDPSMEEEAVAWIKLLDLPDAYKKFLKDHQVENVIFMGMDERGIGETVASRFKFKETFGDNLYAPRSIYLMRHQGGTDRANDPYYKRITDLDNYELEKNSDIADWESGLPEVTIRAFSASIKSALPNTTILSITSPESIDTYNLGTLFALKSFKKNNRKADDITGVSINEYLIGYPAAEAYQGKIPFLYLQFPGAQQGTAERLTSGFLQPRVISYYEDFTIDKFKKLKYHLNAKYDRSVFRNTFRDWGLESVEQNTWQKADVWDPEDGMNAPCEMLATELSSNYNSYKDWVFGMSPLDIQDLKNMADTSHEIREKFESHPTHKSTRQLYSTSGVSIDEFNYSPNAYWQKTESTKRITLSDYSGTETAFVGYMDGKGRQGEQRAQRVIITQFDLDNQSDEYDLRIGYKFNPSKEDGFDPRKSDGVEQVMDCFEFVRVPHNDWMDIPSRMMERNGALWVVNGSVYDFDYNGLPGVVPYIKKNGVIKAQPQILSYKGEAAFAWKWGAEKKADIFARPKDIPDSNMATTLKGLYSETETFPNVLGAMTYMKKGSYYDIKALQPQWMLDYKRFAPAYLGGTNGSGHTVRCVLANLSSGCEEVWAEGYTPAKLDDGWNNCDNLKHDEYIKRFSALAYQQYETLFDYLPNSRTYVAIKGKKLDIGIVDGDYGKAPSYAFTKKWGMTNWELSNYMRYKGYDKFVNLDGGSSSQIWLNGRGPLHDWKGYPLKEDNQGPYNSRLVSSFMLLVPKVKQAQIIPITYDERHLTLDNSARDFDYSDSTDHSADKAFVSLGTGLPLLDRGDDPEYAVVAGNFSIENTSDAKGAILYYIGEDMYYEDTEGKREVIPVYRNATLIGVGKMPKRLNDALQTMKPWDNTDTEISNRWFRNIKENEQSFYYVRTYNGRVQQFFFYKLGSQRFIDNIWHSFMVRRTIKNGKPSLSVVVDNITVSDQGNFSYSYSGGQETDPVKIKATHAAIGAANHDGRFITGNAKLKVDNFLFIIGRKAMEKFSEEDFAEINEDLTNDHDLSSIEPSIYSNSSVYAFQFEETEGHHSFSASEVPYDEAKYKGDSTDFLTNRLYGLNLNVERVSHAVDDTEPDDKRVAPRINVAGEQDKVDKSITIYPNPTSGNLYVNITPEKAGMLKFEVIDYLGRTVMNMQKFAAAGRQMITLDISPVKAQGNYILKISNADGTIHKTQSFIFAK
jgi:hypothetical protein